MSVALKIDGVLEFGKHTREWMILSAETKHALMQLKADTVTLDHRILERNDHFAMSINPARLTSSTLR